MSKTKIWLSLAHMGGQEQEFIKQAFDSNWVVPMGPNVDGFENDLQDFLHNNVYVAALSSGTAALHLALVILGVEAGDEVICQSFTFAASANPIVYQGATPIFVDSETDTWNMCPDQLERAIVDRIANGKKPKAIIPVHLYGMPAKMTEILAVASKYNIPLIEDAAEALGSKLNERECGTLAELSILSFNGNKIITTSGGGALVANDIKRIEMARFLATQSRDSAPHYQHSHIGYNYRMSNIVAGIGRGQMLVLPDRVLKRRAHNLFYKNELKGIKGISFQNEPNDQYYSNYWLTTILVDPNLTGGITREDLRLKLEEENIESRPLWKPMHLQPIFNNAPYYGSGVSEHLFDIGLCLPSGSILEIADLQRVVSVIKNIFV
jgi:dTDP-4-amino-4,6-dideoxygalactose transaminase